MPEANRFRMDTKPALMIGTSIIWRPFFWRLAAASMASSGDAALVGAPVNPIFFALESTGQFAYVAIPDGANRIARLYRQGWWCAHAPESSPTGDWTIAPSQLYRYHDGAVNGYLRTIARLHDK